MPLPVGTTSESEYVDITMEEALPCEEIINRLNGTMPEGVHILQAAVLPEKSPSIMKDVAASAYRVTVPLSQFADGKAAVRKILSVGEAETPLPVMKHTKSGTRETDVRSMLFHISLLRETEETAAFYIVTAAGNEATLRPDLALQALWGDVVQVTGIHRLQLLTKEEMNENGVCSASARADY